MDTLFDIISTRYNKQIEKQKGDVGIEIEVEGECLPDILPSPWRVDSDSSLRGESYEYVTLYPLNLEELSKALNLLASAYIEFDSIVHDSMRAGVHAHINVQELTVKQMFTFVYLYYILEETLVHWCGDAREGNHFCLRHQDAEGMVFAIHEALESGSLKRLNTDNIRYSSLNMLSLFKYGSLEFRAMRGTSDLTLVETWAKILMELKKSSLNFQNPKELTISMSGGGELSFLKTVLPTYWQLFQSPDTERSIRKNCRRIQTIAFETDWDGFGSKDNNIFSQKEF